MTGFGYAGEILEVNLSDGSTSKNPSDDYTDMFLGGRGIASRLYWEKVSPKATSMDSENCLICASGPVAGFPGFAGSRWKICGKSPAGETETFSYGNLGGKWGVALKYTGYDGLVINGTANKPVYIFIDNGSATIRYASHLWGQTVFDACDILKAELGKGVSILSIGPAGEHLVSFANIITDEGASGSGGLGAVMGSKRLKAVVVAGKKRPVAAHRKRLKALAKEMGQLKKDSFALDMPWAKEGLTRKQMCFGCGIGCDRGMYTGPDGRTYKSLCQAAMFYSEMAKKYYGELNDEHLQAARLCDSYGLDSVVMQPIIELLIACHRECILSDDETGLPLSNIGSIDFIETLIRMISFREGFGNILADGTIKAAKSIGKQAEEMMSDFIATRAGETKDYDPRIIMTTALLYATEPRRPIQQLHEIARILRMWINWTKGDKVAIFSSENFRRMAEIFWGGAITADFSTIAGKALAAKNIQDRTYVKESLVLCDRTWADFSSGKVRDSSLESRIVSAITGKEIDETGLNEIGERCFNLQRAILLRENWGGRKGDSLLEYFHKKPLKKGELFFNVDGIVPGKNGEVISRVGSVLNKDEFERMKDEYYNIRGWDIESGLPMKRKLMELRLNDIADDLESRDLLR